ncbi:hypothetical protein L202_00603 [Cryptococcus amylolentus CBS 6039]|uniref:Uncharacterized protein n=1 Tax=Cryptococcus amylolentus CBS 6039 TaxID=1295533 RepID=A0A1E3I825_9TREE|nr:hypothetical protein L202_00603 [Cryptococcus amylolentus CBS 6039]ODN84712.1 hypothetical protein L202_00603 [Cryptococcus amylolentus CBS 6039]
MPVTRSASAKEISQQQAPVPAPQPLPPESHVTHPPSSSSYPATRCQSKGKLLASTPPQHSLVAQQSDQGSAHRTPSTSTPNIAATTTVEETTEEGPTELEAAVIEGQNAPEKRNEEQESPEEEQKPLEEEDADVVEKTTHVEGRTAGEGLDDSNTLSYQRDISRPGVVGGTSASDFQPSQSYENPDDLFLPEASPLDPAQQTSAISSQQQTASFDGMPQMIHSLAQRASDMSEEEANECAKRAWRGVDRCDVADDVKNNVKMIVFGNDLSDMGE